MSTPTDPKTIPEQISEVLSPLPASPKGQLHFADYVRAGLSFGVKTGLFALTLTQLDTWGKALQNPYAAALTCGLISTGFTLLRMATREPPAPAK